MFNHMKHPFEKRGWQRSVKVLGVFFIFFIVCAISNSLLLFSLLTLSPILGLFYFPYITNKEAAKVNQLISEKFSDHPLHTIEAYDENNGFGFISLTNTHLYFVPKTGDLASFHYDSILTYGTDNLGLGDYIGSTSNIGNISVTGIREKTSSIFYVKIADSTSFWHVKKSGKLFDEMKKIRKVQEPTANY